jgi:hypothetical protein
LPVIVIGWGNGRDGKTKRTRLIALEAVIERIDIAVLALVEIAARDE